MAVRAADARRMLLELPHIAEGRSYGMPSFLLNGHFFARFRDDDTVLVLQLPAIDDRDLLMRLEPRAFFFTDHYRDYPAILIRLADVPQRLFKDVVKQSWNAIAALRPKRPRAKRR